MADQKSDKSTCPPKLSPPKATPKAAELKPKVKFDFNPTYNAALDLRSSCTKEEAVAKMLGWICEPVRLALDEIDIRHISIAQMPYLPELLYSLEDHLLMLREDAFEEAYAAYEDTSTPEHKLTEVSTNQVYIDELITNARAYTRGIDEELAKGKKSALKIDNTHTKDSDETLITLNSLNDWAKANYDISILEEDIKVKSKSPKPIQEPQRADALRIEIIEILSAMQKPTPAKVMHALRAKIGSEFSCILANDDDGLIWVDNNGKNQVIKIKALGERIRKLIKPS